MRIALSLAPEVMWSIMTSFIIALCGWKYAYTLAIGVFALAL